jgi:hypothetical protein
MTNHRLDVARPAYLPRNHGAARPLTASGPAGGRERAIAFASDRSGNNDIYSMAADGTEVRQLTDHPGSDILPAWSPDGTRIVFTSDAAGDDDVWVMNADGTGAVNLTRTAGSDTTPDRSPLLVPPTPTETPTAPLARGSSLDRCGWLGRPAPVAEGGWRWRHCCRSTSGCRRT